MVAAHNNFCPSGVAILARSQDKDLARSQDRGLQQHPTLDVLFVADAKYNRIQSFSGDGNLLKQWGSHGTADGEFDHPGGMAVLALAQDRGHPMCNCIFVADVYNHRIQVFGLDGSFIRKWGSHGRENGQFDMPIGIAVLARSQDRVPAQSQDRVPAQSQDGVLARSQDRGLQKHPTQDLVYVTDFVNHRVQVFGSDGKFIRKWGTRGSDDGQFNAPHGVAVHPTRDLVFVSELGGHRIQAFRSDGTFLFKWGSLGSDDGQFETPRHVSLYPSRDLLFVTDNGNLRVQVFDLNGSFVCKWGSKGEADGKFNDPSNIEVDGEFDYPANISAHPTKDVIYVCDHMRVQAFSLFGNVRKCKKKT